MPAFNNHWETLRQNFLVLIRPRLLPFILAAATVLVSVLYLEFYFLPRYTEFVPKHKAFYGEDDIYTYISYRIKEFERREDVPLVVTVGGSSFVQALEWPDQKLEEDISRYIDRPIQFLNLAAPSQTLTESWMIVSNLPINKNTIVFVGVNLARLRDGLKATEKELCQVRVPFLDRSVVRDYVEKEGGNSRCLSNIHTHASYYNQYFSEMWDRLTAKREAGTQKSIFVNYKRGLYGIKDAFSDYAKDNFLLAHGGRRYLEFEKNQDFALQTIKEMHDYVTSKGAKIVFIDLPRDPSGRKLNKLVEVKYRKFFYEIQKEEIKYVNLINTPSLRSEDFRDMVHMVSWGRRKFFPIFASIVGYHVKLYKLE